MFARTRQIALATAVATTFAFGGTLASAQVTVQDGLINVTIGNVTVLEDVDIGVAAQVAANACGFKVGPVAVLGTAVDRTSQPRTVCTSDQGPVTLQQN